MTDQTLANHFHDYFSIQIASTIKLKEAAFKLRYDVYCVELGYEKDCPKDCEKDMFDDYSTHILILHKETQEYAGCIRLVTPPQDNPKALLPFEVNCSQIFNPKKVTFLREGSTGKVGEISRLAVSSMFRRRSLDAKSPEGINLKPISQDINEEIRYFPFIAIGLYFAVNSLAEYQNLTYAAVMMEPALARQLNRLGITFIQLSETGDYHGQRALFYSKGAFINSLTPQLKKFYQSVEKNLTLI